jgi:hypothetical protein
VKRRAKCNTKHTFCLVDEIGAFQRIATTILLPATRLHQPCDVLLSHSKKTKIAVAAYFCREDLRKSKNYYAVKQRCEI